MANLKKYEKDYPISTYRLDDGGVRVQNDTEIEEAERLNGFNIVVIDSCEYLESSETYGYQGYGYFAHKGNCRFCKERRQKELEKLIEQLKK